jgi:RNA polymerase sigma-70 factor (ECF subfamily)
MLKGATRYNHIEDRELIYQFLAGDSRAFEALVRRHKVKIFTSILQVTKDRTVAEDLFQETLIKIIHIIESGKYNEEGKFLPWALRVARNMSIDYFRKERRNPQLRNADTGLGLDHLYRTEENTEKALIRRENTFFVRKLINQLPEKQKEVLIMRHYNDMSFKEIAEVTNVSINTALGRMRYALVNLRKLITGNAIEPSQFDSVN